MQVFIIFPPSSDLKKSFRELRYIYGFCLFASAFVFHIYLIIQINTLATPLLRERQRIKECLHVFTSYWGKKYSATMDPGNMTHFCQFSFSQWVKFNQYFVSEGLVVPQRKITGVKI